MKLSRIQRMLSYLLLAAAMPLVVLLSCTFFVAFDDGFFLNAFESAGTAKLLGLEADGMARVAENLTGYMAGRVDSMDLQVPINGEQTRFYNDKELTHMVDVRSLMDFGRNVRGGLLLVSLLLLTVLRRFGGKEAFWRGLLASALGALGFAGLLGLLAVSDFSGAFYKFHEIFFTNDLWLLDPATDRLIMMLPESFFFSITARILLLGGLTVLAMGAAAVWGIRLSRLAGSREVTHADTL